MIVDTETLIENARTWVGVPFLHQGRSRNGADCLGFISACAAEVGSRPFLDALPLNYGRNPQSLLVDELHTLSREVRLQPGVILLIKFPLQKFAAHGALYTGESMIHTDQSIGKVVEHRYGEPWITRTESTWAIPYLVYT